MVTERMILLAKVIAECGVIARDAWIQRTLKTEQNFNTRPEETMDFFTTLDAELDERLMAGVAKHLKVDRFLTEEGSKIQERNAEGGTRAGIDSLDGSSNFSTYRPDFGISVAIEENGEPKLGCIMTPVRGELVVAEKNGGVWFLSCYNRSLQEINAALESKCLSRVYPHSFAIVNSKKNLRPIQRSRVYVHTGKRRNFELDPNDPWNTIYAGMANPGCSFACTVALLETAIGKLDGAVIAYQNHWDYAAGRLLIQEAGGHFAAYQRDWSSALDASEFATANAEKNVTGDEWLVHIIASGTKELFDDLRSHFPN